MSCALAEAQNWPDAEVPGFDHKERARVWAFKIPGERKFSRGTLYYMKRPAIDIGKWYSDHEAKLRGMMKAEGL